MLIITRDPPKSEIEFAKFAHGSRNTYVLPLVPRPNTPKLLLVNALLNTTNTVISVPFADNTGNGAKLEVRSNLPELNEIPGYELLNPLVEYVGAVYAPFVAWYPLPDLSLQVVIDDPLDGAIPVPAGSAASYHITQLEIVVGISGVMPKVTGALNPKRPVLGV